VTAIDPPGGTNSINTSYTDGSTIVTGRGASQVTTTLDGFGRPVHTVNAVGVHTSTTYDAMGRKSSVSLPYREGEPVVGTEYAYDGLGRVTCEADGAARCLPMPSGAYRRRVYSGNTVEVYDENNHKTTLTFAAFGNPDDARLVSVRDADNKLWTYGYNAVGSLTSVTSPDGAGNRSWVRTSTSHDLVASETHPESGTTTYTYDAAGMLSTKTDANGVTLTYGYDGDDRLVSVTGDGVITTIAYEPGSNNRKTVRSGNVYAEFDYDAATGRLVNRHDTIEGAAFDTHFEYDENDNLLRLHYPSGRRIQYVYNAENQVLSVFNIKTGQAYAAGFDYHASGGVRSYQAGNGVSTSVGYDANRYWVTSIQAGPMQLTYGYDNVGNITNVIDAHMGNQTFTYDALDRLATASGPYSMTFAYDAHGNRQTTATGTYTYYAGKPFHLKTASGIPGDMNYDANGNLLSGPGVTLEYAPENMLKKSTAAGVVALFSYDVDQWRAYKFNQTTGVKSFYVRGVGNQLLSEWTNLNGSTAEVRDYIYAGSRLVAVQTASNMPTR
jgi:YD repeat-containing protein